MKVGEYLSLWEMRKHVAHPSLMKPTEVKVLTCRVLAETETTIFISVISAPV